MHTTVTAPDSALVQKLEAADQSLRVSFSGLPVDEIVPEVERSIDEIGIELSSTTVAEWAHHISDRADYVLDVT